MYKIIVHLDDKSTMEHKVNLPGPQEAGLYTLAVATKGLQIRDELTGNIVHYPAHRILMVECIKLSDLIVPKPGSISKINNN